MIKMAFNYLLYVWLYLLISASYVQAFFRINCNIIQTGRIDPVINPGSVSTHVHTVAGASGMYYLPDLIGNRHQATCLVWEDK